MSAMDPVAVILAGLDRQVTPRPEFADALLARLLEELGMGGAPAAPRPARRQLPRFFPSVAPRLRLALIVIAILLLLGGIATATYLGVRTWVSAGPRGVQFTSDFTLTRLASGVPYPSLALRLDWTEAYAITADPSDLTRASLLRVSGLREGRVRSEVVLHFRDLKDPALWDPGADLSGTVVPDAYARQGAAVDAKGDIVLIASVSRAKKLRDLARTAPESTALLLRRADGSVGRVLTLRELVSARLLDASAVREPGRELAVTVAAPGRLFLYVQDNGERLRFRRIYEVVDPNADGDWSDREIKPLELPRFLGFDRPVTDPHAAWYVERLLAEPSVGGDDRSRSFLLAVTRFGFGERRVYRVEDANADGDALDTGELVLVFSGSPNPSGDFHGVMAPRVVVRDGKVQIRELLLAGFTTRTRVSRAAEDGTVTDIARAFSSVADVAADPEGAIYVLATPPDGNTNSLYKLEPVPVGTAAAPSTSTVPAGEAASATARPSTAPTSPAAKVPQKAVRIAVGKYVGRSANWFLVGADGRRLGALLSGGYPGTSLGLQSPRATRFAYWSDREIPNEPFLYVARADGGSPRKVTEEKADVVCWPFERSLLLQFGSGSPKPGPLLTKDVVTGRERVVLKQGEVHYCAAESHLVLVRVGVDYAKNPRDGGGTFEILDLHTGKRSRLLGPPPAGGGYNEVVISPDGKRVAYTLGQNPEPDGDFRFYSVHLMELATGKTVQVMQAKTQGIGAAYFSWSPSSDRLLLEISRPRPGRPCTAAELTKYEGTGRCQFWDLALVDAERGTLEPIASALPDLPNDFWAPDGASFAYTRGKAVHVVPIGGKARRFPGTAGYELFGWSPDGRYVGLLRQNKFWNSGRSSVREIAVLDVASGNVRTVVKTKADFFEARWWR